MHLLLKNLGDVGHNTQTMCLNLTVDTELLILRPSTDMLTLRLLLVVAVTVYFMELIIFSSLFCSEIASLSTNNSKRTSTGDKVILLTDVHVLGERRRNRLDIWWTDRQLQQSITGINRMFQVRQVIALGDHIDEGLPRDIHHFEGYSLRFNRFLRGGKMPPILGVPGNHDISGGRTMDKVGLQMFENHFGPINVVHVDEALHVQYISVNTMLMDACLLGLARTNCAELTEFLDRLPSILNKTYLVVLLSHVPLYRENDLDCGEIRAKESSHVS